jgi:hypothetical protein
MWLVIERPPSPDKPDWYGRRRLAMLDAVLWPLLVVTCLLQAHALTGIVRPMAVIAALAIALIRLRTASSQTHRYGFTTWWVLRPLLVLFLLGLCLKVVLAVM